MTMNEIKEQDNAYRNATASITRWGIHRDYSCLPETATEICNLFVNMRRIKYLTLASISGLRKGFKVLIEKAETPELSRAAEMALEFLNEQVAEYTAEVL